MQPVATSRRGRGAALTNRVAPARTPLLPRRWAALVAVGGGLIGVLAFPRFGWWPLAFLSVALLSVAVDGHRKRTAAGLGYLYGAGFMLPLVHWTGVYVGPVPWLILGLAMAGWFALLGTALSLVQRLPAAPAWIGAAWILQEFLRDRVPFGGFPWGRLAFSQAGSPVRWFAPLGGAPLVSFVVAVGGGGLALAALPVLARPRAARPLARRVIIGGLAVLVAVPLLGALLSWPLRPAPDRDGHTETVALIQGGLPSLGLEYESRARQVLDNHVRQTLRLAAEVRAGKVARPDLVLWPEDSSDVDPLEDPIANAEITKAVKAVGVPVLVGAILNRPRADERENAGILWSPTTGPGAMYVKRHPVPFGEYIPLRGLAEKISSAAKTVTQQMVAGHGNGLVRGGPVPIGDVICFEVAYDSLVQSSVRAGAQLLVVQTNNATFGHTAETYQQLAMSQLRAVETGRTVLQVATTGMSAVIGPDGTVRDRSGPLFAPDILIDSVPLRTGKTLAVRVGAWPEYVLTALAVLAAALVIVADRRRRGDGGAISADPEPVTTPEREPVA